MHIQENCKAVRESVQTNWHGQERRRMNKTWFGRKSNAVREIPYLLSESTTNGTSNKRPVRPPSGQKKRTDAQGDTGHI
jgi:hypothetical protein